MRFSKQSSEGNLVDYFIMEFSRHELEFPNSKEYSRLFITYFLSRIGNMVAAYWFKKNRDQINNLLNSEDFKLLLARELADRINLEAYNP